MGEKTLDSELIELVFRPNERAWLWTTILEIVVVPTISRCCNVYRICLTYCGLYSRARTPKVKSLH